DRPARAAPRWLSRARDLLEARPAARLTLAEIAAAVDVHPVHLARAFRRRYGCSVGAYPRPLRLDLAARALSSGDAPVSEIALAAGFSDQSHFSRTFKRTTGLTPAEFRSQSRTR